MQDSDAVIGGVDLETLIQISAGHDPVISAPLDNTGAVGSYVLHYVIVPDILMI